MSISETTSFPSTLLMDDLFWSKLKRLAHSETGDWKWREPFFKAASEIGLPKSAKGAYAGVRISALHKYLNSVEEGESLSQEYEGYDIVYSSGKLVKKPSWPSMTLEQIARHPAAQQRYKTWAEQEKDPLALLNGAMAQEALFCRLPDGYKGKIRFLFDSQVSSLSASRITLWVGARSEIEIECTSSQSGNSLSLDFVDLILEDSSLVKMSWERAATGLNFAFLRTSLMKSARFDFFDLSEGSAISRLDAQIKLMEENSFADLRGLALLDKTQQNQTHIRIEHVAPSCESSQLFKVLLKGQSRSHFQGKIYVHPLAQKTQAYQSNRNLLLSDQAQAQSWPNLEIFADDVKASHGSATGSVDNDSLFYLLSRGIDKETATGLLAHGFALEVLSPMSKDERLEKWKQKVMAL